MKLCQHLMPILNLVKQEGNEILTTSRSELMTFVVWMNLKLSSELKRKIQMEMKKIEYKHFSNMPHNPASECFICNECKNVIAFPCSM